MTTAPVELAGQDFIFDGETTYVMGVINLSPESRVAHSVVGSPVDALARARQYRDWGASIIDLGAQSSHFENRELPVAEELDRLLPALSLLVEDGFVVSVDSWKPAVMTAALAAGAAIVNDTGGLAHPDMVATVSAHDAFAVVMYIEGENPLAVDQLTFTDDGASSVIERFRSRVAALEAQGMTKLVLDPGLSINYRSDYEEYGRHQIRVIRSLDALRALGHPVLVPVPRKAEYHRMLTFLVLSIEYRADIIRVHDVEVACDLVRVLGRAAD